MLLKIIFIDVCVGSNMFVSLFQTTKSTKSIS